MVPTFFKRSCTIHRLRRGPLAGHVDLLAAKLATEGFSRVHSRIQLRLVGHFNRWLGNRKGIEEQTTTWDKTVVDRQNDLKSWVVVLRSLVEDKRIRKIFAFANNHYAGHAPATVKQFRDLWNEKS